MPLKCGSLDKIVCRFIGADADEDSDLLGILQAPLKSIESTRIKIPNETIEKRGVLN